MSSNKASPLQLFFRWLPAVIWMGVIFYLSHQPGDRLSSVIPWFQAIFPWMNDFNWGHVAAYFVLALCVYTGLGQSWSGLRGKLLTVLWCAAYGLTDEFHQMFVPGRTPELRDIWNDALGATAAMALISIPWMRRLHIKLLRILSIKY